MGGMHTDVQCCAVWRVHSRFFFVPAKLACGKEALCVELCKKMHTMLLLGGKSRSSKASKDGPGLPKVPQNSAEPLGFCRKVLEKVSHSRKPVEERFCRTPKVLQNLGNQAQLFRPCKFFSHLCNPPLIMPPFSCH